MHIAEPNTIAETFTVIFVQTEIPQLQHMLHIYRT